MRRVSHADPGRCAHRCATCANAECEGGLLEFGASRRVQFLGSLRRDRRRSRSCAGRWRRAALLSPTPDGCTQSPHGREQCRLPATSNPTHGVARWIAVHTFAPVIEGLRQRRRRALCLGFARVERGCACDTRW
jgi:hypothetical protein